LTSKDFECACGKYKRTDTKESFDRCGVEVTEKKA
jgi:hypothetical protein